MTEVLKVRDQLSDPMVCIFLSIAMQIIRTMTRVNLSPSHDDLSLHLCYFYIIEKNNERM